MALGIFSHIVIDSVQYQDWTPVKQIGGAGAYAAVGASLACAGTAPILVAGVGSRHRRMMEEWCRGREIVPSFFEVSEYSPITHVTYSSEEYREEVPEFGLEHFEACTPFPSHVRQGLGVEAFYVFHDAGSEFWQRFEAEIADKGLTGSPLVWEIAANSCTPESMPKVLKVLGNVTVLSINWNELECLSDGDIPGVVSTVLESGTDLVVHAGTRGTLVFSAKRRDRKDPCAIRVGIYPVAARDFTGGGNTFTGALAQKIHEGFDVVEATTFGAAAASLTVESHGASFVDERLRYLISKRAQGVPVSATASIAAAIKDFSD